MTPCGTVGYTAPEIVKDERYSKGVDMWALGCVLYTLLCGFPPFYDESIPALTEKVARGQYTFLSPWWDDISKSAQDLVSHLLTVDPEKRYNIKKFLNHPWIRQTDEETYAADDAPPTPFAARQKEHVIHPEAVDPEELHQLSGYVDQPSSMTERRMDFRSPGAVNLREVFDVGYAVHRQEEEGKLRVNFRQGFRGVNSTTGFRAGLNTLNEDYDGDGNEIVHYGYGPEADNSPTKVVKSSQYSGDVAAMEVKLRSTNLGSHTSSAAQARQVAIGSSSRRHLPQGYGQHNAVVSAAARQIPMQSKRPFELNLDNSTLLGRRGRRGKDLEVA
jgi:serine/threonine-protein kinase RCK2